MKHRLEVTAGVADMCMHFNLQMSLLVPLPEGELSPISSSKQNSELLRKEEVSQESVLSEHNQDD